MRAAKFCLCLFTLSMMVLALDGCDSLYKVQKVQAYTAVKPGHTPAPVAHTDFNYAPIAPKNGKARQARLLIPSIGVNAAIEALGVTANGDLAVPNENPWTDVGWYEDGPRPGEQGSAVIDGHLDRPGGYPAVFWDLRYMHASDEVTVIDTRGKALHFHVTRVAFYPPQDAPIQEIFGNESGSYLNLITCAGDWIPSEHQTTLRLVVYTALD